MNKPVVFSNLILTFSNKKTRKIQACKFIYDKCLDIWENSQLTSKLTSLKSEFLIVLNSKGPLNSFPKSVFAAYRKIVSAYPPEPPLTPYRCPSSVTFVSLQEHDSRYKCQNQIHGMLSGEWEQLWLLQFI